MGEGCRECGSTAAREPLQNVGLALVGGLLGSSCCVLQLGLNLLTGGALCAGFAALDPLRPLFLAGTAGTLVLRAPEAVRTTEGRLGLASSLGLFVALAASPMLLRFRNRGLNPAVLVLRRCRLLPRLDLPGSQRDGMMLQGDVVTSTGAATSNTGTGARVLSWDVAGLKCEGCAAGLKGLLHGVEGVMDCSVAWGGVRNSQVEVRLQPSVAAEDVAKMASLCKAAMLTKPGIHRVHAREVS